MKTDIVVQLTGDCPLIDPYIIDETIKLFLSNEDIGYAASVQTPTRLIPDGMDVVVFKFDELKSIEASHQNELYREHPPLAFEDKFLNNNLRMQLQERFKRDYFLRITLDNKFDYMLMKEVHEALSVKNDNYGLEDILKYFDTNKEKIMSEERFA
jgi:spore coat polysaccharide biosynthesis protein SpsF (cytidylyltransferase family)